MLFVADQIPPELRRTVEFLNEQMDPAEVLAVELRQYTNQGLRTLVPRVFGQTAEAERRKTGGVRGEAWTEARFFEALKAKGSVELTIGRSVYEWSKAKMSRIWWGHGLQYGSFVPEFDFGGLSYQPFAVFTNGYRRVKKGTTGTTNLMPDWTGLEVEPVKRHLEWRGNLEGLVADRLILIEGSHDENFYEKLRKVFNRSFRTRRTATAIFRNSSPS